MIHNLTDDYIAVVVPQGATDFSISQPDRQGRYFLRYRKGTLLTFMEQPIPWPAVVVGTLAEYRTDEKKAFQLIEWLGPQRSEFYVDNADFYEPCEFAENVIYDKAPELKDTDPDRVVVLGKEEAR